MVSDPDVPQSTSSPDVPVLEVTHPPENADEAPNAASARTAASVAIAIAAITRVGLA